MTVVDANVVVGWLDPDAPAESQATRLLARFRDTETRPLAPRLIFQEVATYLLKGVRSRRWSGEEADEAFLQLQTLPIRVIDDSRDIAGAWALSRRYDNHPVYDMVYVSLAQRLRDEFITKDLRLAKKVADLPFVRVLEESVATWGR